MNKGSLIVVTGAAGMIGSGIVRHLNDSGYSNLLLVDDLKRSDKWKNLLGKTFVDLVSRHAIGDLLKDRGQEIDAIIHMGACSDTTETNLDYLMENNYHFSIRLAEWALSHNKRFIYASSAATYGDGSRGFSDEEAEIEELRPLNGYAFSKQLVDLWMKREGGFQRAVGLKYFNIFGPNEYHKERMASMILKMMRCARDDGKVYLYRSNDARFRDGEQRRDFLYVKDAVRMTCCFLEPSHWQVAGLYNIGRGESVTWNAIAGYLFRALDRKTHIEYIDMPEDLAKQYQNDTCADMRKWNRVFPQTSQGRTPIGAAVHEYVREYLVKDARW